MAAKIGVNKEKEKDVNLQIALCLKAQLQARGVKVILTREGDVCLATNGATNKKVSDMHNRVSLINASGADYMISIHQNSLPGHPGVSGAQVFHNGQDGAEALALCIQNDLNMAVNTREKAAKRIDDSIYIMKHADCPAVLVECGFLSNPEETVLLQQPDYQLHMAAAIAAGFCQYCTNEG